jgi:hypothetical protein
MTRFLSKSDITLLLGLCLAISSFARDGLAQEVRGILTEQLGFSESDLRNLDGGQPVVRVPSAEDNREVAVFGIVRAEVPAAFVIERMRHIEAVLAAGDVALQVGRFGETPSLNDMAGFALPRDDARALRECRPGKCDVKLPADVMQQVQSAVDWSASDAEAQANRAMASWLIDYLNEYRQGGDAELATYDDKSEPLSVAEGFDLLLRASPLALNYRPELAEYLDRYPGASLDGVEDYYYWSVEDFGLKPVTHLYHSTLYMPAGEAISDAILTRKQIYASHYFQAAVSFLAVAPIQDTDPNVGIYLVLLIRQRFDGKVGGIKRMTLERRLRDNTTSQLQDVQKRLEESFLTEANR